MLRRAPLFGLGLAAAVVVVALAVLGSGSKSAACPSLSFDGTTLRAFFLDHSAGEAITEVPDPAGSGQTVFKFTVGDSDETQGSTPNPRGELISWPDIGAGDEFWWSTKFFLPAGFPARTPGWVNLLQGPFGGPTSGSPPFHIEAIEGSLQWQRNATYGYDIPWRMAQVRDRWVRVMVHERFGRRGYLEMWIDGRRITFFAPGSSYNPHHVPPTTRLAMETMDSSNDESENSLYLQQYREKGMYPTLTTYEGPLLIGPTRESVGGEQGGPRPEQGLSMLRRKGKGLLKLALVFQGDVKAPGSWSGVPAGLYAGLMAAGVDVAAVDATAPVLAAISAALGMAWTTRTTNPVLAEAGGSRASLSMLRRHFDGAIAIGSGYELRGPTPTVTFEDMTVAQALAQPESVYAEIGERAAQRWRERQRRIYERATACCATSEWAASSIVEDYGIDPAKVHVVGMGRNTPEQAGERDWESPRFLFVGIDWERKRGPAVLAAFSRVIERYPSARLDVVGGGNPALDQPGVTGHGLLPLGDPKGSAKLAALLRESTCLVMPSAFEPFGIAHLDAGAAGVPSIGTTNGGAATAIGDGGLLVDPGDPDALLAAMLELCDPETARRLGERARENSRRYTWQAVAERVVAALDTGPPR